MTDINCDVPTALAATAGPWRARPGAFSPRSAFPGTGVLGAALGTGPSSPVQPVPHVRVKAVLAPLAAPMAQVRQTNNYIQMTSVFASGAGAVGPPPDREPA